MIKTKKPEIYGNESISSLKGADRVRLRPGVIFGSDGIDGCQHSFFEILSNSIDEAREGFGNTISVTRAGEYPSTTIPRRKGTTGSWSSASSTPAASTKTTRARIMNSAWA